MFPDGLCNQGSLVWSSPSKHLVFQSASQDKKLRVFSVGSEGRKFSKNGLCRRLIDIF